MLQIAIIGLGTLGIRMLEELAESDAELIIIDKDEEIQYRLPFGGGSGAGVTINPVAFLVIQSNNIKLMPVSHSSSLDRLLDYVPDLMEKTNNMMNRIVSNKKEETEKILKEMQKRNSKDINKVENEVKDIKKEVDSKKMEEENNQDD